MKRFINNFKKAPRKEKNKLIIYILFWLMSFFALIGFMAWLIIEHNSIFNKVEYFFNPINGIYKDKPYQNGVDNWINKYPTFGDLYQEMGKEAFAWFILTNFNPTSITPFVMTVIFVVFLLFASFLLVFKYYKINPPLSKIKKNKKATKEVLNVT